MKAEEIFKTGVKVMKELLSASEMSAALQRARKRTEEENVGLLIKERENINELVRKIADRRDRALLQSVPQELIDALVLRYLKNRHVLKTLDGIEHNQTVLGWHYDARPMPPRRDREIIKRSERAGLVFGRNRW
jgi:hypothetical protein